MKRLFIMDAKDYSDKYRITRREASRGIIINDNKILLVYSGKNHDYKFPGGGIRFSENQINALKREVLEETGYSIIDSSIKPYGYVMEKHKSLIYKDETFVQVSNYYLCKVIEEKNNQNLDDYEKEYEFEPIFIDVDEAIKANEYIINNCDISKFNWIKRDTLVLKYLKENLLNV